MLEVGITRAPRGALVGEELVTEVAEQGDLAERHYLELKSTIDLATKMGKEKISDDEKSTVGEYLSKIRARLIDAMPWPELRLADAASLRAGLAGLSAHRVVLGGSLLVVGTLMEPEQISDEECLGPTDRWESRATST